MSDSPDPDVLAALADPTRRRLLDLLAAEPLSASALSRRMTITRQAIVKHLDVLSRSGLLRSHREGREVVFVTDPDPLESVVRWLDRAEKSWQAQLQGLKAVAEQRVSAATEPPGARWLHTDDADAAYAWMVAAGMPVRGRPHRDGDVVSFDVEAPDGSTFTVGRHRAR